MSDFLEKWGGAVTLGLALAAAVAGGTWLISSSISQVRTDLSAEISQVRTDLSAEIAEVRSDLSAVEAKLDLLIDAMDIRTAEDY